jgi:hypothetical protein
MTEVRFVKVVKGRYWMLLTEMSPHPHKVFKDRYEAKTWLIQQGVPRTLAESRMDMVDQGSVIRVSLAAN